MKASLEQLETKLISGYDAATIRELNILNYRIEVAENRLKGAFINKTAYFETIEIIK